MANCQHMLTSMELDFKIFIGAVKFLVDKPAWHEIFVNMTPEQRTAWVHHDFDGAATDLYSMANCQHMLTSMELDFKIFIRAVKFLVDKPAWREIFVNMTPEQRTAWVHHDFDGAATDLYSMANCQHILTSMELDFKIFIGAVKFLVDKPAWREIFVNMTPEQRTAWVHHDFDA
ncbi:hypothetical protein Pint_18579 [Pistacia integerrima]|uniref:Uncharacterized protein n=1 Tax=Pistacia integerrima TaxID=434235 RepID=A0ACC0YV34_9ROSI|nr:hypothetical protein Pint_18579 [Pistacia integerrima]